MFCEKARDIPIASSEIRPHTMNSNFQEQSS